MAVSLPLKEMTIEEKLRIMEDIWDDLRQHADQVPIPSWHGEVLAERKAAIERGEGVFTDWETARRRIEKEIE